MYIRSPVSPTWFSFSCASNFRERLATWRLTDKKQLRVFLFATRCLVTHVAFWLLIPAPCFSCTHRMFVDNYEEHTSFKLASKRQRGERARLNKGFLFCRILQEMLDSVAVVYFCCWIPIVSMRLP